MTANKPCPFCDQPATETYAASLTGTGPSFRVGCENPGCPVRPGTVADSLFSARSHWNSRPADNDLSYSWKLKGELRIVRASLFRGARELAVSRDLALALIRTATGE